MFITLPKMSPEFLFAFLERLDFEHATKVRIELNSQRAGREMFEDGREVWIEAKTLYQWKGEDCKRLLTFEKWPFVRLMEIEWDGKTMIVDEHFTAITLYGHTSLPDISGIPGPKPQKITMIL
jgi:hypothetical protein